MNIENDSSITELKNKNEIVQKERLFLFDNLKLFCIVLVVFGHLIENLNTSYANVIYKIIYLFHMPMLVFISGYFAKFDIKKCVKRILIPYIIIQLIWSLFEYFIAGISTNFLLYILQPRWALWYLLSLFIWRLSVIILDKLSNFRIIFFMVIFLVFGLCLGFLNFNGQIFSVSRIICFYPYFLMGYISKRLKLNESKILKQWVVKVSLLILSIALIIIWLLVFSNVPRESLYNSYSYQQLLNYTILVRLMSYACGVVIILTLITWMSKENLRLTKYGKRTMSVYLLHLPFVNAFLPLIINQATTIPILLCLFLTVIIVVACILLSILFEKFVKHIKAKIKFKKT